MLSFRNLRLSALAAIATAAVMLFIVQILRNARPAPAAPPPQTDVRQAEALARQVESLRSIVEQMKVEMTVHQQQQETAASNTATTESATKSLESGLPEQIARLALLVNKLNGKLSDAGRRVEASPLWPAAWKVLSSGSTRQ